MKNRFVREALEDILKPKSKVEIEKEISQFSAQELLDYYIETNDKNFLNYALKRGLKNIDIDELEYVVAEWEGDNYDPLIPLIIPHLNFKITKTRSGYNLHFNYWDDFSHFFESNREITVGDIEIIISGEDSYRMFERDISNFSEIDDLGNIFDHIPIADKLQKLLLKVVKSEGKDVSKLEKWEGGFESLFDYISEHENDIELEKIVYAIDYAYGETQAIADEDKARDELINAIQKHFGFNIKPKIKNDLFVIPVNSKDLIKMFKMQTGIEEGINYYPPQYGWIGDIEKYDDVFNDALWDKLDDINLNESVSDILKPKSEEDIINSFKQRSISDQIDFLELEGYENKKIISEKYWPLIIQIKEQFKKDYNDKFRVTSTQPLWATPAFNNIVGSYFKIYSRDTNHNPIRIQQYNHELYNIRIVIESSRLNKIDEIIKDYQEFLKWFNNYLKTNESLGNIFKPKSKLEIKKAIKSLDNCKPSKLYSLFREYLWENPVKGEPLIFRLNRMAENYYKDAGNFEKTIYRPGVRFSIFKRDQDFIVIQYDGECFARVFSKQQKRPTFTIIKSFKELKKFIKENVSNY